MPDVGMTRSGGPIIWLYKLCIEFCPDIDECKDPANCDGNDEYCQNTQGSFNCVPCNKGFRANNSNDDCEGKS